MEGDSQQTPKIEADEQVTVGDTATTTQEKNASGSEGSDGFVKLEELEDSQITSKTPIEPLEEVPTQTMEQTSEEFTKLIPTEELKSTLGKSVAPVDYLQEYYDHLPTSESLEGHWDGGADSGLAALATEVESDKCVIEFEEVGEVIDDYLESSDFQQGFIMNDKC